MNGKLKLVLIRPTVRGSHNYSRNVYYHPDIEADLESEDGSSIGIHITTEGASVGEYLLRTAQKKAEWLFERLSKETEIKISVKE